MECKKGWFWGEKQHDKRCFWVVSLCCCLWCNVHQLSTLGCSSSVPPITMLSLCSSLPRPWSLPTGLLLDCRTLKVNLEVDEVMLFSGRLGHMFLHGNATGCMDLKLTFTEFTSYEREHHGSQQDHRLKIIRGCLYWTWSDSSADATEWHRNKTCIIGLTQTMFKTYLKHLICKLQNVSGSGSVTLKQAGGSGGCASPHLSRRKAPYLLLILLIQPELQTRAWVAALIGATAVGKGRRGRGEELLGHLFWKEAD